jgi:hypothetical protein
MLVVHIDNGPKSLQAAGFQHYGLPGATLPSAAWPEGHIKRIIKHIVRVPRPGHFVDGSKGW